jgi:hypothetical protein
VRLTAAQVFAKPGEWSGIRHRRYLHLAWDQSKLIWSPWRDDEGVDEEQERSADIRLLTCVSTSKGSRTMVRAPRKLPPCAPSVSVAHTRGV